MIELSPPPDESAVEKRGRLLIPKEMAHLSYTPIYATLSPAQRLRYNHLQGYYFLEQTVFFEQCMGRPVLEALELTAPAPLRSKIRQFIEEENRHTTWFHNLLRECEPDWYKDGPFHLLRSGLMAHGLLRLVAAYPKTFCFLLWLQIIAEERAQYFSGQFIGAGDEVDPRFVEVQRKHLSDEGGHIRYDSELIEWVWTAASPATRQVNARLLRWTLWEYFYLPKRSGWNVVEALLREFPELAARQAELRSAMQDLASNQRYLQTLYPRKFFPRTRRLAERWPELQFLEEFFTA